VTEAETFNKEAETQLFMAQREHELVAIAKANLELSEFKATVARHANSDLRNRVYNFLGPIAIATVEEAAACILNWDRESREQITLRLMSPGGEVPAGLYLYDLLSAIVSEGTPVTTVALGNANSMAAVVLQAGSKRLVGPNSWITLHEVSVTGNPYEHMTVTEKEEQDKTIRRINTRLVKILSSRSKVTEQKIARQINKKDWTLEPEQAIELGFADAIGYR
jgi:ATP-dependent protease ClpP protease subunit